MFLGLKVHIEIHLVFVLYGIHYNYYYDDFHIVCI